MAAAMAANEAVQQQQRDALKAEWARLEELDSALQKQRFDLQAKR
jgi:hypothetical protein